MSTDNEMLRTLVREALRDALGGADGIRDAAKALSGQSQKPAKTAQVVEMVSLSSNSDLTNFVNRVLDLATDAKTLNAMRQGELVFQLGTSASSNNNHDSGTTRIEKGAVTESTIRKAAESGSTLIVARKVVVTSLARDKARDLGVTIIREGQQDKQKGSVMR